MAAVLPEKAGVALEPQQLDAGQSGFSNRSQVADVEGMSSQNKSLLHLPDPGAHARHQFHTDLVMLLAAAGCSYFKPEQSGKMSVVQHNVRLDEKRLAAACNSVARFCREDGAEVPMPLSEAGLLLESNAIPRLPYR